MIYRIWKVQSEQFKEDEEFTFSDLAEFMTKDLQKFKSLVQAIATEALLFY